MNKNEHGGIISKLIIIPAGLALMAGFFFLGYYVGRYQSKTAASGENVAPLPEMITKNLPKPEDFTFYKTLTEKENKSVSIELKPKPAAEESRKQATAEAPKESAERRAVQNKKSDDKNEKTSSASDAPKAVVAKPQPARVKKDEAPNKTQNGKLHYTVQVASYPDKQLADDEVKKMKGRGYAAFVVSSAVPNKGTWYRVRLGSFTNKGAAEKLAKDVQAKAGIMPIITIE